MKNIFKFISIISLLRVFTACEGILDVENLSAFEPDAVWNDENLTNAYITDLYRSVLPSGWPTAGAGFYAGGSADETLGILAADLVNSTGHSWAAFSGIYTNIRKINTLLSQINSGKLSKAFKDKALGQAHFFRAWSYFHLLRVYGGVPLVKKPQGIDDDLFVPRASSAETFAFIEKDLDEAIKYFGNAKFVNGDRGRVGTAAALAFKSRVMLQKASPQFNPGNPYGNSHWAAALAAAKKAKGELDKMGFALHPSYPEIFSPESEGNNKEAILTVIFDSNNRSNGRNEAGIRPLTESKNATGSQQPIWKFVAAFPMADGLQPGSSSKYDYNVQTYWKNRDPRFYDNIVGNAFLFQLSGKKGRRQYTDEAFADVNDQFSPGARFNRTGFYPRKGVQLGLTQEQVALSEVDWIEIRYAEVLLNYAEAANEQGDMNQAVEVIRQLRKRAGIEPGSGNTYGVTASTREAVREAILHERRIEFAFEGKRFWDLRRLRKLHTVLDGTKEQGLFAKIKSGLPVEGIKPNAYKPEDFDYKVVDIFNLSGNVTNSIPESYYFFPITLTEINRNKNLKQNKDWGGDFDPTL